MLKIKNKIFIAVLSILLLNPTLAMAQANKNANTAPKTKAAVSANANNPAGGIGSQYTYQGVDQSISAYLCTPSDSADGHDLERCVNKLYRFGVAFGAIAVVFFIILAGYMYITGGESAKSKAKGMIQNSLVGIGILLASYLILNFINPNLTLYKAIQPPIFDAGDLPTCQALGMGNGCEVESDGVENVTSAGTGAKGTATTCKGGLVSTPSSIPHLAGASKLCKDLADKLSGLAAKTPGISWVLTSSISGTHVSSCHGSGNANSGNCVDLALNGGRSPAYNKDSGGSTNPQWGKLCTAIASLGQVNFANEASNQAQCQNIRAYKVEKYTSGPNLHINFIGN